jgi:HlyD family secretion protein
MPVLFRTKALAHVQDPDQLDQVLRVVGSRHWMGFGIVSLVVLSALVWSIVSTAPVIVSGPGVLLSPAGVAAIHAGSTGHIDEILVRTGDAVQPGQPLATVRNPERLDRVQTAEEEAREAVERHASLQEEFATQDRMLAEMTARIGKAYAERLEKLEAQRDALERRLSGEQGLQREGLVSAVTVFTSQQQLAQLEHELALLENQAVQLSVQEEQQLARRQHELADLRIRVQSQVRRAENLRRDHERQRLILAEVAGVVAELVVDAGDPVSPGQTVARLLPLATATGPGRLTAIAYLPADAGKSVAAGMQARIDPATVKFELDGYLLGTVAAVAELPASREGLMRRLRNSVLVDEILRGGTTFEIEVHLLEDATTPSGYAWTSGRGPNLSIEPGTPARVEVVTGRAHVISLLFPAVDHVYGWFRGS